MTVLDVRGLLCLAYLPIRHHVFRNDHFCQCASGTVVTGRMLYCWRKFKNTSLLNSEAESKTISMGAPAQHNQAWIKHWMALSDVLFGAITAVWKLVPTSMIWYKWNTWPRWFVNFKPSTAIRSLKSRALRIVAVLLALVGTALRKLSNRNLQHPLWLTRRHLVGETTLSNAHEMDVLDWYVLWWWLVDSPWKDTRTLGHVQC